MTRRLKKSIPVAEAHNIGNFMSAALMTSFCDICGANAVVLMCQPKLTCGDPNGPGAPSIALVHAMNSVVRFASMYSVSDSDSLNEMLARLREGFSHIAGGVGNKADRAHTADELERYYRVCESALRAALKEALAGFPVSAGSFQEWWEREEERQWHSLTR